MKVAFSCLALGRRQDSEKEDRTFHGLQVLGMNNDLWDRFCGLGCEIWMKGEWV